MKIKLSHAAGVSRATVEIVSFIWRMDIIYAECLLNVRVTGGNQVYSYSLRWLVRIIRWLVS